MATRQLKKNFKVVTEWLDLASRRVDIPTNWLEIEYQKDADLLFIKLLNSPAAYGDDDLDQRIVYNYDKNGCLVSIEILNLYGVFATV